MPAEFETPGLDHVTEVRCVMAVCEDNTDTDDTASATHPSSSLDTASTDHHEHVRLPREPGLPVPTQFPSSAYSRREQKGKNVPRN